LEDAECVMIQSLVRGGTKLLVKPETVKDEEFMKLFGSPAPDALPEPANMPYFPFMIAADPDDQQRLIAAIKENNELLLNGHTETPPTLGNRYSMGEILIGPCH